MSINKKQKQTQKQKAASSGYEVGYGKPPKEHRFKKGAKSPHPEGRPKGAKGLKSLVCEAAEAPAEYVIGGKKRRGTRLGLAFHQMSLKAAKGDLKATEKLAHYYGQFGPPSQVDMSMINPAADQAALDELIELAATFSKDAAQ